MVTQMDRTFIQTEGVQETRNARRRRSDDYGERVLDAYFAVMTILVLGVIVGIGSYAIFSVIPALERSHSSRGPQYHQNFEFEPHSSEIK
jgi:hypothetical protein